MYIIYLRITNRRYFSFMVKEKEKKLFCKGANICYIQKYFFNIANVLMCMHGSFIFDMKVNGFGESISGGVHNWTNLFIPLRREAVLKHAYNT